MTDEHRQSTPSPDPADKTSAEGERPEGIPAADRGTDPHVDPAAKDQPAEGGVEEAEQ